MKGRGVLYSFRKSPMWVRTVQGSPVWEQGLYRTRKEALDGTTGYGAMRVWVAQEKQI